MEEIYFRLLLDGFQSTAFFLLPLPYCKCFCMAVLSMGQQRWITVRCWCTDTKESRAIALAEYLSSGAQGGQTRGGPGVADAVDPSFGVLANRGVLLRHNSEKQQILMFGPHEQVGCRKGVTLLVLCNGLTFALACARQRGLWLPCRTGPCAPWVVPDLPSRIEWRC